jgi:hypothetical protein
MKDGKCPKCNSTTVFSQRKGIDFSSQRNVYVHVASELGTRPTKEVDYYVCTTCGYFESYIEDRAKLDVIAKDWKKIDG